MSSTTRETIGGLGAVVVFVSFLCLYWPGVFFGAIAIMTGLDNKK